MCSDRHRTHKAFRKAKTKTKEIYRWETQSRKLLRNEKPKSCCAQRFSWFFLSQNRKANHFAVFAPDIQKRRYKFQLLLVLSFIFQFFPPLLFVSYSNSCIGLHENRKLLVGKYTFSLYPLHTYTDSLTLARIWLLILFEKFSGFVYGFCILNCYLCAAIPFHSTVLGYKQRSQCCGRSIFLGDKR